MLDITTCQPQMRPVRRIHPKPQPLLLLPAWRVHVVDLTHARQGRTIALQAKVARKAAAFQPVDTILVNPTFAARVEALTARHARLHTLGHAGT